MALTHFGLTRTGDATWHCPACGHTYDTVNAETIEPCTGQPAPCAWPADPECTGTRELTHADIERAAIERGARWAIVARRPHDRDDGGLFLGWSYLPTFILDGSALGILSADHARTIALAILGSGAVILDARAF